MTLLDKIKQEIIKNINLALNKDLVKESDLVFPPDAKMGDLSLPCFDLAKELKKSPAEIVLRLAKIPELSSGMIFTIKTDGPYLNFTLDKKVLAEGLFKEINKEKGKFGQNLSGKKQKIMIEYANGNTHKEFHVGHVRNICYGDAVSKILSANGYNTIPVSYINDFGIHVAKTLWALQKFYLKTILSHRVAENGTRGYFLGQVYVRSSKEAENNEVAKKEINQLMAKIESRKGSEYKLWQTTRKWSIDSFAKIYQQLGVKFKATFYESEVIDEGRKLVSQLVKANVLKKSQGAVIADLEKYDLGVLVFLRSDGTALYPVADLPLAVKKFKKYKLDESIYAVDIRQGQYFKQLFKVLELMGYKQKMIHLGYEFLKLPSGMMASRTGKIITFETFWEEAHKRASEETAKRHSDWPAKKIKQVAEKILVGAMKFEMVKVSRTSVITFDIDKALRFEGFTAAYVQYTGARIQSILRKSQETRNKKQINSKFSPQGGIPLAGKIQNSKLLREPKEHQLIMKLAKYPETVKKAAELYEPSEVAKYLFELAQEFNDYYHAVPVLKADSEVKAARLVLINSVNQVLANGLNLLGIETIEEM